MDQRRILCTRPWSFNRCLFVLTEPTGIGDFSKQNLNFCSFWIQLHKLPLMSMTKVVGLLFGSMIGEVVEVDKG